MSTPEDAAVIEAAVSAMTPPARPAAAPAAVPAAAAPLCDNCGASVPGRYCGNCGQRLEPPVHSLGHFLKVAFEDVTHADSRLWRTLAALLVKPGYLTREFLTGHRARYLPPVRLYLVLSVVFFLCASLTSPQVLQVSTERGAVKKARIVPLEEANSIPGDAPRPGETVAQRNARECGMISLGWPLQSFKPAAQRACLRIRNDNAHSLAAAIQHNLPRTMFLFLPLLAGIMMLMYWRPRHYYVEHLLLLLHNHAFVFLIVPLAWGLSALLPFASGWIDLALFLYMAGYMYRSMRVVYGQGGGLTFAKLLALGLFYFVFGMLMFLANFAYSALTLD